MSQGQQYGDGTSYVAQYNEYITEIFSVFLFFYG